jgi:hypothetical protein
MLEDVFSVHWSEVTPVFVNPAEDCVLQVVSGRVRICWCQACECCGVGEVDEAILDVLLIRDSAGAEIFVGIWEKEVRVGAEFPE